MLLRITVEVINGAVVTRFNGNNSTASSRVDLKKAERSIDRLHVTAAHAKKAKRWAKEAIYAWRYLDA